MTIYYYFYSIQILFIVTARLCGLKNNKQVLAVANIFSVLFAGLRGDVGVDTIAYRTFYDKFGETDFVFEPLFTVLAAVGNLFDFNSQFFILLIAFFQGLTIYLIVLRVRERDIFYLVFLSTYYIYLNFNLIRVGLAVYLVGFALVLARAGERKASIVLFSTAVLTHVTAMVVAFSFWSKWYRSIPFLFIIVLFGGDWIQNKLLAYVLEDNLTTTEFSLGIGYVFTVVLLCYCVWQERRRDTNKIGLLFAISVFLKIASFSVSIADRIAIIFGFAFFTLFLSIPINWKSKLAIVAIIVYNTYGSLSFVANSDAAMNSLINQFPGMAALYGGTQWVPYRFFWE